MTETTPSRRSAVAIAIGALVLVTAFAALGALQILVLNPLAAVPGATLAEISEQIGEAGFASPIESEVVFVIMGIGVLLATMLLVVTVVLPKLAPQVVAAIGLALLVLGTPADFIASFGPGMTLADTFGISGGDHSPWSGVLYMVSALALLGLVAMVVAMVVGTLRHTRAARPALG